MRRIKKKENIKRGCSYCADMKSIKIKEDGKSYMKYENFCIHNDGCPYHELDPYDTYDDYLEATKVNFTLPI